MRPATALPSLLGKEVRALLWPTAACAAAMVLPALGGLDFRLPLYAYLIGVLSVGAIGLGHEYSNRTLGVLLSHPIRRERLYVSKTAASVLMVGLLASLAYVTLPPWLLTRSRLFAWIVWPSLGAICVAPWMTMLARSAVAGVVFTFAVPAVVTGIGLAAMGEAYWSREFADAPLVELFGLAICSSAAVAGRRTFLRLEVVGDNDAAAAVTLPGRLRFRTPPAATARTTSRRPLRHLIEKELRLQQLSMALAGLYLTGWLVAIWASPPGIWGAVQGITAFYALFAGALVGAAASAEERQLGTLEWQLLLPVRARMQWFTKSAVVFGLALVLAIGLPALLAHVANLLGCAEAGRIDSGAQVALFTLLAAAGGLYVSSLSRHSAVALVATIPSFLIALFLGARSIEALEALHLAVPALRWFASAPAFAVFNAILGTGLFALAATCAFHNHRRADRSLRRVALHTALIAAYILAWAIVVTGTRLATGTPV